MTLDGQRYPLVGPTFNEVAPLGSSLEQEPSCLRLEPVTCLYKYLVIITFTDSDFHHVNAIAIRNPSSHRP